MNLTCKTALILLLISAPIISRSQVTKTHIIKFSSDDSGKKRTISKSQRFTLTLPDHVDGGYRFNKPQYNKAVLQLIKHYTVGPGSNNRPGSPGYATWQFIAIKKGASILKITASRPWAKKDIIIVYSGIVLVK